MKQSRSSRIACRLAGMAALTCMTPLAHADSKIPTGSLSVDRTLVRVGSHSQLTWQIQYPATAVTDIVTITGNGTITPSVAGLTMSVRTLGVGFQSGPTLLPVEGSWALNGGSFTRFFYDIGTNVVPTKVLVSTRVNVNDKIDFGGRGWSGSSWFPFHTTRTADPYVIVLKNGDTAPSYVPAYNQASVQSYLKAYIDGSGRIAIGPRDLIILWECSTAAPGTTYFDMQDLVVLVTFN